MNKDEWAGRFCDQGKLRADQVGSFRHTVGWDAGNGHWYHVEAWRRLADPHRVRDHNFVGLSIFCETSNEFKGTTIEALMEQAGCKQSHAKAHKPEGGRKRYPPV